MELRQLRYLLAISEEQNVNRAAKLCFVTQPALTQQIKKLEAELNTSLLIKCGRGIVLSEEGEKLSRHASKLIRKVEAIKQEFINSDKSNKQLMLGVDPGLFEYTKSKVANKTIASSIKIKRMGNDQLQYELRKGMVDAGITTDVSNIKNIGQSPIVREKIYLVASKEVHLNTLQPLDLASILSEPLVLPSKKIMIRKYLDDYLKEKNLKIKLMLEVDSFEELVSVIKHSSFITLLPQSIFLKYANEEINAIELNDDGFYRDHYLIWNKDRQDIEKINFLNDYFWHESKSDLFQSA